LLKDSYTADEVVGAIAARGGRDALLQLDEAEAALLLAGAGLWGLLQLMLWLYVVP
jgi:hypothetical protein